MDKETTKFIIIIIIIIIIIVAVVVQYKCSKIAYKKIRNELNSED